MKRIFYPNQITPTTVITGESQHYIKNVLRMEAGDRIELLSAESLAEMELVDVAKREITMQLISSRPVVQPDYTFTVFQCVLKREYMDTVVEKYTELGVTKIVPVLSARSVGDVKDSTLARYREIAKSATLQCERDTLPDVAEAIKISQIPADTGADSLLFFEREATKSLPQVNSRNIRMVIGPEGGLADDEVAGLAAKGFCCVSPLANILKAETAAVVFAGYLQMRLTCG
jgi:16S rRNA (uracil1498-N3)-methyltransferase